jgi:hypothetical protein
VNVISSTSARGDARGADAGAFIRAMGQAYRASGRTAPIVDTFGHNPYPAYGAERPWTRHPAGGSLSEGDYGSLMQAYYDGFAGTGQPVPGQGSTTVWYLEDGFQTAVDPAQSGAYSGVETDLRPTSAADQATQIIDAVRLAYCQPAVGAFFNFLLVDEADLATWQSGLMWASLQKKPSYDAFKQVAAEIAAGTIDCGRLSGGPVPAFAPATGVAVGSVSWKPNEVRIAPAEAVTYQARLLDTSGRAVAELSGSAGQHSPAVVRFPAAQLAPGSYTIRVQLSAAYAPGRQTTLVGKPFRLAAAPKPKPNPPAQPPAGPVFVVVPG